MKTITLTEHKRTVTKARKAIKDELAKEILKRQIQTERKLLIKNKFGRAIQDWFLAIERKLNKYGKKNR